MKSKILADFQICISAPLIINRESHGVVFLSTNENRLQDQVYRQIKSKLMDIFGPGKKFTV